MAADLIIPTDDLTQLLRRLADRDRVRSEATVQADVRQLLLTGRLTLRFVCDHDIDARVAARLRKLGHDAWTADEAGLSRVRDEN